MMCYIIDLPPLKVEELFGYIKFLMDPDQLLGFEDSCPI